MAVALFAKDAEALGVWMFYATAGASQAVFAVDEMEETPPWWFLVYLTVFWLPIRVWLFVSKGRKK
jgi:hypothetical protein